MSVGRKIYYELSTGDVILTIPQKNNKNAVNTTKEQDFLMFDVLQARNPELIGVKQLNYGELQGDFELANTFKINITTGDILFQYPIFQVPQLVLIEVLKEENVLLQSQVNALNVAMANMMGV